MAVHLSLHFGHVTNESPISAFPHELLSSGGIRLVAVLASAPDLDDGPDLCKAGVFRRRADAFRKLVVVDVRRLATAVANQEDAVVESLLAATRLPRALDTASATSYADAGRSKLARASNTDARISVHCSPRSTILRAAASRNEAP